MLLFYRWNCAVLLSIVQLFVTALWAWPAPPGRWSGGKEKFSRHQTFI